MSASAVPSYRGLPAAQQPSWPDPAALRGVVADLESYPPLVFAGECDLLRERLAEVAEGRAFLLQGGDCAEAFDAVTAEHIKNKLKTLLQMAVVLTYAASVPVVKVGRIAYQYPSPARGSPRCATASNCRCTGATRSTGRSSPRSPAARTRSGSSGCTTPPPRR